MGRSGEGKVVVVSVVFSTNTFETYFDTEDNRIEIITCVGASLGMSQWISNTMQDLYKWPYRPISHKDNLIKQDCSLC